ncbi:hypothetical protein ARMSODRAFT_977519 [Armillaria solidipes]|uniref:Uncharacterized protein n=1 Tax=Armillaria solidipes TaxID=1076256 RepID=A0A2H3BPY3_9AGAR|nr:hypothetical protein ARMSODRAFT_977519 [Armillaria solidipes]
MYTRMLMQVDNGGMMEVNIIMRKAPIVWQPILNMSTISNTKQLLAREIEHSKALVVASRNESYRTSNELADEEENEAYAMTTDSDASSNDILKSAYAALKKRQCPPPKQYFFPYLERIKKKAVRLASLQIPESASPEDVYQVAYQAMVTESLVSEEQKDSDEDAEIPGFQQASRNSYVLPDERATESKTTTNTQETEEHFEPEYYQEEKNSGREIRLRNFCPGHERMGWQHD